MVSASYDYRRQILLRSDLFGCLPSKDVDAILTFARERRYADGQTIFQKGDEGSSLMAVLRGRVRVGSGSEDGKEIVLSIVETGQVLGEIALLDGRPRSTDAVAVGDCQLLVIERRDFVPYLERNPGVPIAMMSVLCDRIRRTNALVEDIAFLELPARVARLLLRLGQSHGRKTPRGLRIDLKLTQKDLGNLIATSRESINKQLRAWQEEGLISTEGGYITLLRPERLSPDAGPEEVGPGARITAPSAARAPRAGSGRPAAGALP